MLLVSTLPSRISGVLPAAKPNKRLLGPATATTFPVDSALPTAQILNNTQHKLHCSRMPSVLGKRARTYSTPSTPTVKQAKSAKRLRTNQNSSTLNADKESECPDKKPLPVATQDDAPRTPTKKPPPG